MWKTAGMLARKKQKIRNNAGAPSISHTSPHSHQQMATNKYYDDHEI